MIRPLDAITLARTKIRSKRLRLLITTIVSALVFGVMAGATILIDGVSSSLTSFARENLRGQYLVQGNPNPNVANPMTQTAPFDSTMIAEVQALNTTYLAERKAAAKRLGITDYDERTEIPPVVDDPNPNVPVEYRRTVNMSSVAFMRWIKAKSAANPASPADSAAFRALMAPLGPTRIYEPRTIGHLNLQILVDGKEDLTRSPMASSKDSIDPIRQTAVGNGQFTIVDDQLVEKYLLPATPAARTAHNGIPVLLTAEDAMALYGKSMSLPKRPKEAAAQLDWVLQVRDRVNGATFVSCYRNPAEQQRVEQARTLTNELEANKNNRDYVKPSLILALPTTPCGMVTVASDTRTAIEKYADQSRATFAQEFATQPEEAPLAEAVTFQVVGLLPSSSPDLSGIDQVLSGMLGTSFSFGAVIPERSWQSLPADLKHEALLTKAPPTDPTGMGFSIGNSFVAAFPTVAAARAALGTNPCQTSWTPECEKQPFQMGTYGTNYLAVDDLTRNLRPVILVLLALTFGIATIIIWAMMGRVIADSRRETAVFRAIGAKRSDIIAVYLTYSLWVAARIVVFAGLIGAGIALLVNVLYADRTTTLAKLTYGVYTAEPRFTFLGLHNPLLWEILGGIVVMSLVAITPPLLRNIRRNPIRDMRDE